jgi:hypothetical protein
MSRQECAATFSLVIKVVFDVQYIRHEETKLHLLATPKRYGSGTWNQENVAIPWRATRRIFMPLYIRREVT